MAHKKFEVIYKKISISSKSSIIFFALHFPVLFVFCDNLVDSETLLKVDECMRHNESITIPQRPLHHVF